VALAYTTRAEDLPLHGLHKLASAFLLGLALIVVVADRQAVIVLEHELPVITGPVMTGNVNKALWRFGELAYEFLC